MKINLNNNEVKNNGDRSCDSVTLEVGVCRLAHCDTSIAPTATLGQEGLLSLELALQAYHSSWCDGSLGSHSMVVAHQSWVYSTRRTYHVLRCGNSKEDLGFLVW